MLMDWKTQYLLSSRRQFPPIDLSVQCSPYKNNSFLFPIVNLKSKSIERVFLSPGFFFSILKRGSLSVPREIWAPSIAATADFAASPPQRLF